MTKRKALGQHFLHSQGALEKILKVIAPGPSDLIIEIGAGRGALTFFLTERAAEVVAVEKDPNLVFYLTKVPRPNLHIIKGDILRLDWKNLLTPFQPWKGEVKLVGNLPYSISSPILFKLLEYRDIFPFVVFLLQKELAARLCSQPGSKDYGSLSVLFYIFYEKKVEKTFPPSVFSPPPKVESALVSLRRRAQPVFPVKNLAEFQEFLRACFRHRRKTLLNNLERMGYEEKFIIQALAMNRLAPTARPEEVDGVTLHHLFNYFYGNKYLNSEVKK
ncbi:MAG: 16S rRNA (adenine(1518)-N(6)/adenine(1519)-N(6))-dimethyltransferase RsmA [Candidatus Aminicenantales bacterium]